MSFFFNTYVSKILRWLFLAVGFGALVYSIWIVERKYAKLVCKKIFVDILPARGQQFITENEAYSYLLACDTLLPGTTLIKDINLRRIEDRMKSHTFVRFCSASKDWKGILKITILPKRALARFVDEYQAGCYLDEIGETMPLSASYTPRVLLVGGKSWFTAPYPPSLNNFPFGKALLTTLQAIDEKPFWKAQVSYITVDANQELIFSTQLSRHRIYFGKAEDIECKMEKLKLFYHAILPYKGWDAYKKVTLKFDNQIVCE
jgi:cell division protein FtsQ